MTLQSAEEQARLFLDRLLAAGLEVVETSRLRALEHENVSLKDQVKRLCAPVSDEEWEFHFRWRSGIGLTNAIIAARAAKDTKCS